VRGYIGRSVRIDTEVTVGESDNEQVTLTEWPVYTRARYRSQKHERQPWNGHACSVTKAWEVDVKSRGTGNNWGLLPRQEQGVVRVSHPMT